LDAGRETIVDEDMMPTPKMQPFTTGGAKMSSEKNFQKVRFSIIYKA
jgi:hypothetical protein